MSLKKRSFRVWTPLEAMRRFLGMQISPKSEELISRPFVGQIQFQLVLLKRIETESAVGCFVFSLALTFFVSQKFAVLKAGQLAGSLFGNMVGKMRNTCEHQRVRRLR